MEKASGVELKAAIRRALAWGGAVQCGAGDGVLILPHSLRKERPGGPVDSLSLAFPAESEPGETRVEGGLPAYLRYDGLDLLFALAMGATGGAPTRPDAVNDPNTYNQTFTLAEGLDGLFATLAIHNGVDVGEYPSVKVAGFTLRGEVGGPLEAAFHCIADDRAPGSSVNTVETFRDVTYFETSNRVLMSQGTIRMNDRDGLALGAGDEVRPASLELVFRRKLSGVYAVGSPDDVIDEPTNDGLPEVTLRLEFPRYASSAHFAAWDSGTPKKLDMTFEGAVIDVNYKRAFRLSFPNLSYEGVDLSARGGILRHPVEFRCLGAEAAPAGMDGITGPFQLEVTNRQEADVLG